MKYSKNKSSFQDFLMWLSVDHVGNDVTTVV